MPADTPSVDTRASIVTQARSWLGTLYKWGGESAAEGGVDCSGLVIDAYRQAGRPFSGRPIASQLGRMGQQVDILRAMPGDVLYWDEPGDTDHVAIYEGNGKYVEAPYSGARVREGTLSASNSPTSIRRILGENDDGTSIMNSANGNGFDVAAQQAAQALGAWAGPAMKLAMTGAGALVAGGLVVAGVVYTAKGN